MVPLNIRSSVSPLGWHGHTLLVILPPVLSLVSVPLILSLFPTLSLLMLCMFGIGLWGAGIVVPDRVQERGGHAS